MTRVSVYDIKNPSQEKRDGWKNTQNKEAVAKSNEVLAKAKAIPKELMGAWDKESVWQISKIADQAKLEELRRDIARIMELAGGHYGISQQLFWQRYHARNDVADRQ
jgi:hypothetical protein